MAESRIPGPFGASAEPGHVPARTPGPLGIFDQGDPSLTTLLGDTPGSLGCADRGDPTLTISASATGAVGGTLTRTAEGVPLAVGAGTPAAEALAADARPWDPWTPPTDYADLYDLLSDPVSGEDNIAHMYLDNKDKVTVGIGTYLPTLADAKKLCFYNRETKKIATDEEKGTDYAAVLGAKPDRKKNPGGFKARYYRQYTRLDMTPTDIGERWLNDVKAFQRQLPSYFKGFGSYPAAARQALTDIAYQYGASRASKAKEGKLKEAAESADWKAAAELCASLEGQAKRKAKRKALFESAAAGTVKR